MPLHFDVCQMLSEYISPILDYAAVICSSHIKVSTQQVEMLQRTRMPLDVYLEIIRDIQALQPCYTNFTGKQWEKEEMS